MRVHLVSPDAVLHLFLCNYRSGPVIEPGARITESWHESWLVFRDLCQFLIYLVTGMI
jgi:hypothetical protein